MWHRPQEEQDKFQTNKQYQDIIRKTRIFVNHERNLK